MHSLPKAKGCYRIWLFSASSHCTHFPIVIKHWSQDFILKKGDQVFMTRLLHMLLLFLEWPCFAPHIAVSFASFFRSQFLKVTVQKPLATISRTFHLSLCHSTPFSHLLLIHKALFVIVYSVICLSPYQGCKDHVCFNHYCLTRVC